MSIEYDFHEKKLNSNMKKWSIEIKNRNNKNFNLLEWFLNSDFLIAKEWWINNVRIVLDEGILELVERGEIVELTINKNITTLNFIQHETFNLEITDLFENTEQLEMSSMINTKELYNIMLEWNKILDQK